jgi:hypothetical protein
MVYRVKDLDRSLRELVQSGHRIDHIDRDPATELWVIVTSDDQLVTR